MDAGHSLAKPGVEPLERGGPVVSRRVILGRRVDLVRDFVRDPEELPLQLSHFLLAPFVSLVPPAVGLHLAFVLSAGGLHLAFVLSTVGLHAAFMPSEARIRHLRADDTRDADKEG